MHLKVQVALQNSLFPGLSRFLLHAPHAGGTVCSVALMYYVWSFLNSGNPFVWSCAALRPCKASGGGFVCMCGTGVRDEGVAVNAGVKNQSNCQIVGAEEGKLLWRVRERRCDAVCYTAGWEDTEEWDFLTCLWGRKLVNEVCTASTLYLFWYLDSDEVGVLYRMCILFLLLLLSKDGMTSIMNCTIKL